MQKHSELILRTIICILCFAISFQILNKAVFLHSHVQDNGMVVTHAHPFDKSEENDPFKSHPHSNIDYFLIDQLDFVFLLVFLVLLFALTTFQTSDIPRVQNIKLASRIRIPAGRAPPLNK